MEGPSTGGVATDSTPCNRHDKKIISLRERYLTIRLNTEKLCEPLCPEDYVVQSMLLASPVKWHVAHTTWFFETLILEADIVGYKPINPAYRYLFNSYYNTIGHHFERGQRGVLSRPTVEEIFDYRIAVDQSMLALIDRCADIDATLAQMIEIGLQHELQHQELILTDLKHMFASNPLKPAYHKPKFVPEATNKPNRRWVPIAGGIYSIGHAGRAFAYDNESPRHEVLVNNYQLASCLVTNGEFMNFMEDGGYRRHELWLSDGWDVVQAEQWQAPLYWQQESGQWRYMTMAGMSEVATHHPVCHLSYFEAEAYARWSKARLPTEVEWEIAATGLPCDGHFSSSHIYEPRAVPSEGSHGLQQMFGDVWEWTSSPYIAYPGFRPTTGALGEYNGKFMCNQFVLRGGSCVTPQGHIRPTYRNFFPALARWQFAGLRLAKDL